MAVNAVQYLKNVGKSFGYSAIDTLKAYNPAITSLASSAKEFSTELYDSIQDFTGRAVGTDDEKGFLGTGKDILKDARKNLFEDLKTGNWYNKQRIDEVNNENMKDAFGFDFDDDFNLDDDWDLDFDDDSDESLASAVVTSQKKSTDSIISSMDAVGAKVAGATSSATVRSADYVAQVSKQNSKALYGLNQRGFQQVSTGIAAINSNISTLVTLGEPLTTHMQNSATFYTKSSEFQQGVLERLDKIVKAITPEEKKTDRRKHTFADMFTAEGTLDFGAYFDMIRDNVKEAKDGAFGMLDMVGGVKGMAKSATASPMKFITDNVVRMMIPELMKNSMQSFNQSLSEFFPAALDKLQTNAKPGGILDMLGGFLFPKRDLKKNFDTGKYNHGVTQWTGESEIALKEVIPTYLAYITSALTGQPVTRFDYTRGKFVRRTAVRSYAMTRFADEAKRAGGKFREDSISAVKATGLSEENQKAMIEEIEQYFLTAFERADGRAVDIKNPKKNFNAKDYGLSEDSANLLRAVLRAYEETGQTRKANAFAGGIRTGRERYAQQMRELEVNGDVTRSVYDNSDILGALNEIKDDKSSSAEERQKILFGTDEYNHDIFFYLREIYRHTGITARYAPAGALPSGGGGPTPTVEEFVIPMGKTASQIAKEAEEKAKAKWEGEKQKDAEPGEDRNETFGDRITRSVLESGAHEAVSARGERSRRKADADAKRKENAAKRAEYQSLGLEVPEEYLDEQNTGDAIRDRFTGSEGVRRFGKLQDKIQSIMATPTKVMTDILSSGEDAMYRLIYGKEGDEKGLFSYFFEKADGLFSKIDDHFKEKFDFSLKEWGKNLFGGLWKDTKESGKEAFDWTKQKVGSVFGFGSTKKTGDASSNNVADAIKKTAANLNTSEGGAARGRNVTRTGVISVSEGEYIVPAKYNPYYNGPIRSTSYQLAQERAAADRYFGNYAEGGTADGAWFDDSTGKTYATKADAPAGAKLKWYNNERLKRAQTWFRNKAYDKNGKIDAGRTKRNVKIDNYNNGEEDLNVKNIMGTAGSKMVNGIQDLIKRIVPDDPDKEAGILDKVFSEQNKKALKDANIKDEVVNNKGAMGFGAIVGAGASLLTGGIVGPFLGAGIGAATGLLIKSDKVQNALFGEVDSKTGEREGGILPKKVADFMTKELPGIGIGAGVGGAAGLFMGSPVMGAILGGTIGFVAKSDKVKNALFGEKDEDGNRTGGLVKKEMQDRLKKALPNMAVGGIAGLLVGPFGPVGNIILGSAIGYATTSEKFKSMVLGEKGEDGKRHGGMVGRLGNAVGGVAKDIKGYFLGYTDKKGEKRQGILDSIQSIFKNLANQLSQGAKNMFTQLRQTIRTKMAESVKTTMRQRLGKLARSRAGKVVQKVGRGAKKAIKAPFSITAGGLEAIDNRLQVRGIQKGYNAVNKDGTKMTSRERLATLKVNGKNTKRNEGRGLAGRLVNFDNYLMDAVSRGEEGEQELRDLQQALQYYNDPAAMYDAQESEASNSLAATLDEYEADPVLAQELEKAAKGKYSRARRKAGTNSTDAILAEMGLSEDQNKALRDYITKIGTARSGREEALNDKEKARQKMRQQEDGIFDRLKKQHGIDIQGSEGRNYLELVNNELAREYGADIKAEKEEQKKLEKEFKVQDSILNINDIVQRICYRLEGKDADGKPLDPEERAKWEAEQEIAKQEEEKKLKEEEEHNEKQKMYEELFGEGSEEEDDTPVLDTSDELFANIKSRFKNSRFGKWIDERKRKKLATVSEGEVVVDADSMTDDEKEIAEDGYAEGGLVGGSKKKKPGFLGKIHNLVSGIYKKIVGEDSKAATTDDTEGGQDKGLADGNDKVIQKATEDGVVQYIQDKDGDMVENTSDPGTKAVLEAREEKRKGFAAMPKMAAMLGGIGGTLTGLGSKLFGDGKEKKKGIFATLLESLTGEGSFLGGIFGMFSKLFGGSGIVKAGKSVISTVGGLGAAALEGGLLVAAFSGLFDGLFEKIGNLSIFKGNDTESTLTDNTSQTITDKTTGETYNVAVDEDGNFITNNNGEYLTTTGEYVSGNMGTIGTDTSFSKQLAKNLGTGALMGTGSVATKVVGNMAKKVTKTVASSKTLSSAATKVTAAAGKSSMLKSLKSVFSKIWESISGCKLMPKAFRTAVSENADDLAETAAAEVGEQVAESSASAVASKLDDILIALKVVTLVATAINAWGNAESILGITQDATVGQKFIAVCVAVVNAAIPFIGNLIPNKVIVNIFMKIAPMIGIDVSTLEEEREAATAEVEAYNEENGTDLSIEEYNQMNGKAGVITKAVNKVKSFKTNVKEQGFKTTVSNAVQTAGTKLNNARNNVVEKISTVGGKITDTASNVFDSIKNSSIVQGYQNMLKTAKSGEIGTLLTTQLIDTSDDDTGAMANIVNGTLGTISKILLVPIAAVCKIGVSIKNAVGNIVEKIKNGFNLFQQSFKDTTELFTSDDENITLAQVFDNSKYEDEDNPLNGFQTSLINMARFLSVGVLVVKRIGRAIAKPFKKLAEKVTNGVQRIDTETSAIKELALNADIKGTATYTVSNDEENPINGFQRAIVQMSKIVWVPTAIVLKVGKSIKTGVNALIDKVSNGVQRITQETEDIRELANEGNIIDTATYTIEDDDENPIGGFQKAIVQMSKIVWVPVSIVRKVGSSIKTGIGTLIDKAATGVENISEQNDAMRDLAKEGDVSGVIHYTIEDDDENPIGGFAKGIVQLNKIVYTPLAMVHKVGSAFKTAMSNFTDNVSEDAEDLTDATDDLKEYAEDGKPKKVLGVTYSGKNSILSPLFKGVFNLEKLMYTISSLFNGMFSTIGNFFSNLFDGDNGDGLLSKFKTWLNKDTDSDSDTTESGGNSGLRRQVGGASNIDSRASDTFISQTDKRYSNIEFGRSNIGDVGCGPAAATMLMNYTNPGTISMKDAIKEARKYEDPDGTSADYFQNVLSDYGMTSNYMDTSTKKGQNSLKNSLASGQPAILLGQNLNNDTKTSSPFGPNKHYVTATGFDVNGNVIINDPESTETKAYDPKILNSVSLGIGTDMPTDPGDTSYEVGGSGYKDNTTTQNIWAYFKNAGYSDAAVAGIMGNIYAESNFDPAILQSGKGPAAGLFQWESYTKNSGRFKDLSDYASSKGLKWSDLDAQLPFAKKEVESLSNSYWQGKGGAASNLTKAGATATTFDQWKDSTDVAMATRQFEAAFERAGKPAMDKRISAATNYYNLYSGKTYEYTGEADSSSSSSSSDSSSESYTIFDIVSAIGSALSSALSGTSDSSTSSSDSSSSSGEYTPVEGSASGNVSSNAENAEKQKSLVNKMYSIAGTLKYAQNNAKYPGSRNPDDGSGDCSSTVQWAYKNVLGVDPGSYTGAQRTDSDTYTVATSTKDESKLQLGDLLLKSGHVEMYSGNGKMIGHGGGSDGKTKGPTEKALNQTGSYNLVRRWVGFKGGDSGLDDVSMPTVSRIENQNKPNKVLKFKNYSGGASGTSSENDNNAIIKLLKSILQATKDIVTNTEDISTISDNIIDYKEALEEMKTKVSSTSSSNTNTTNKSTASTNINPEDDPGIQDLVETLNAIAAG